MQVLHFGTN